MAKSLALLLVLLAVHTQGWILNCNFGDVNWTFVGAAYTCTGVLQATEGRNLTSVNGTHSDGRNDSHVQAIALSNQNVGELPQGFELFFSNITVLSGSNLNLTQLSRVHLASLENLQLLILPNNYIESLDGDTFSSNPSLEYINLSNNQLRNFGPNLFSSLTRLRTLRLLNNVCFNQYVDNNATEMSSFLWRATFNCPPSFEQLERDILNGQNFENALGPILQSIWNLEIRVTQLETSNSTRVV